MDPTLQQVLSSYEMGLKGYKDKLGDSSENLKKALALYDRLHNLAEGSTSMTDFYAKPECMNIIAELSTLMPEIAKEGMK